MQVSSSSSSSRRSIDIESHATVAPETGASWALQRRVLLVGLCVVAVATGALNVVLGKVRAKPLGACNYVSGIVNTCVYCLIYGAISAWHVGRGNVPKELLQVIFPFSRRTTTPNAAAAVAAASPSENQALVQPLLLSPPLNSASSSRTLGLNVLDFPDTQGILWGYVTLAGICDCAANLLSIVVQPYVPGPIFALMNQATLPMAACVSVVFLRKRYTAAQTTAMLCVVVGGIVSLVPELTTNTASTTSSFSSSSRTVTYSLITVLSTLPLALSSAVKEKLFRVYSAAHHRNSCSKKSEGGGCGSPCDMFVFAALVSFFQLIFTPLFLPLIHMFGRVSSSLEICILPHFSFDNPLSRRFSCQDWRVLLGIPRLLLVYAIHVQNSTLAARAPPLKSTALPMDVVSGRLRRIFHIL